MQQSDRPIKPILPIAQNDASKATIPTTSADDTRASQSLGFPPRTGLPPEAGGVPPQLSDMNGLLYLLSGVDRWIAAGGRFPFDNAFATNELINGYPLGAVLPGADALGDFISIAEGNQANPNTVGTGWVPGYQYGATSLTGVTGGTVTLTPAQAAKRVLRVAGTLTSNLVLVVPGWQYDWTVYNNTSGAFTVSVRTASGSAAAIPQNNAPTPVVCDGTNCTLLAPNIAPATSSPQALQLGQATGRLLRTVYYRRDGANAQTISVDAGEPTTSGATVYTSRPDARWVFMRLIGGGGGGGGSPATTASENAAGGGGGAGGCAESLFIGPVTSEAIVVGLGGASGTGAGAAGTASTFRTVSGGGGGGGGVGVATSTTRIVGGGNGGASANANLLNSAGGGGSYGLVVGGAPVSGAGGASTLGGGANAGGNGPGGAAQSWGGGGAGAASVPSSGVLAGGAGRAGIIVIYEYA